ncbi:MAG: endolytic transglycosylase MltG [Bacteroidota bacterium]
MSQDESQKKGQLAKIILTITFVGVLVATIFGYQKYQEIFGMSVPKSMGEVTVEIPTNSSFEEVVDILKSEQLIQHEEAFRWVAERMKYPRNPMRSGKFKIQPGWSNYELIQHLRGGKQETVKLVFNHAWTVKNVAAKVAEFIEPDSSELIALFNNEQYLSDLGYSTATLMSLFIPNTYDFFWNTSPAKFLERMKREHESFWNKNDRKAKAKALGLTPEEVYVLASIVERETNQNDEKRRMAGVYYNRLKTKGWRLEADPTVKFAVGDFGLRRILNTHLQLDSPYNTYKYGGLPPGPISMASIASIDAVLNVEKHDYMFFCSKGDGSGYHSFAKSLKQHNRNAAIYRANMRKSGAWNN